MAKIKAILFDLDGTLRDTKDIIVDAYQHAVEMHNGQRPTLEELQPFIHHHTEVYKGLSAHIDYETWLATYRNRLSTAWMEAPFLNMPRAFSGNSKWQATAWLW
ncbi:HAD hydrolase-like protein [Candidatus Saccharibacteria bacterium]|nr:MAG: HAD hydrolase-like protein [Candidatus Saccharibacteria bacterium]